MSSFGKKTLSLIGSKIGRLTLIKPSHGAPIPSGQKPVFWSVLCECGKTKIVRWSSLQCGRTLSCGCLQRERASQTEHKTHGMSKTPIYSVWAGMIASFHNYGGRGIEVCNRWLKFENFYKDMGDRPAGMSIDRVDNNGNYEPGNCRWATQKQQLRNTRNTVFVETPQGKMSLSEASEVFDVNHNTLHTRVRRGLSGQDLVKKPTQRKNKKHGSRLG